MVKIVVPAPKGSARLQSLSGGQDFVAAKTKLLNIKEKNINKTKKDIL